RSRILRPAQGGHIGVRHHVVNDGPAPAECDSSRSGSALADVALGLSTARTKAATTWTTSPTRLHQVRPGRRPEDSRRRRLTSACWNPGCRSGGTWTPAPRGDRPTRLTHGPARGRMPLP